MSYKQSAQPAQVVAGPARRGERPKVRTCRQQALRQTVKPLIHTVYVAETAKATSDPLTISVRPFMRLAHFSRTRGIVRVAAAYSMLHRFVLLQVWHPRTHVWSTVRRVRLTAVSLVASPTVITRAVFRLRLHHGLRIRTWMPFSQAQPGYISGASNAIRS